MFRIRGRGWNISNKLPPHQGGGRYTVARNGESQRCERRLLILSLNIFSCNHLLHLPPPPPLKSSNRIKRNQSYSMTRLVKNAGEQLFPLKYKLEKLGRGGSVDRQQPIELAYVYQREWTPFLKHPGVEGGGAKVIRLFIRVYHTSIGIVK